MAQRTTLGALVAQHFSGTLLVANVGDMQIAITNDPDFDAATFTVEATGTDKRYRYPLFGNQALALEDISLTLAYNGPGKPATGAISADLDFGGIDLAVSVTLSSKSESFAVISQLADPVSLLEVVQSLSGGKVAPPPGLAKTRIKSMDMSIVVDGAGRTVSAACRLDQAWVLPIGSQSVDAALAVTYQGKKSVALTKLGLAGAFMLSKTRRLDVTYDFGPKLSKLVGTLSAGGPPVVVGDLLKLFGIKVRKGFPNSLAEAKGVDLAQGRLELDFANNAVQLSGDNSLKQAAFAYAERVGSAWRLALGVAMAAGWKMADLSSALKNVDEFLSFEQVFVALATDSLLIDDTVFARMGAHRFQLLEGLNVGAVIALDARQGSPLAQALRGLLGGDMQIFLEASLGPKPDEISFSAALGGELDIKLVVPGEKKRATLGIKSPTLKFTLEPSLSLSGEVTFPATDGTVDITGGIDITPTSLAFRGHAHDPDLRLAPPKQAAGLVLQDIGGVIKAAPGALEIGLDGTMAIGADQAAFAFAFAMPEMFPAFLYARFDSLDLAPMFKALCKARQLPKPLSKGIVFREVTIWSCEDPSGRCTFSDGRHVASGFAFAGQATVFGFPADAALAITTAGMSGRLSMGCSVSVPGVFTVSDATDHSKGPQFAFNTTRTPYLRADYYIDVLGVRDTAQLQFTNEGFSLDTSVTFKQRKIRFHCVLGAPSGRYVVEIDGTGDFRKAPIPVYSSKLVTLKLSYVDIRFSSTSGFFSVRADGKLGAIPKSAHVQISLGEIGHKLEQLGRELEQELGNVKNWL